MRGDAHLARPEAVGAPGSERQRGKQKRGEQASRQEFCCEGREEMAGEVFGWHGSSPRWVRCHILERRKCKPAADKSVPVPARKKQKTVGLRAPKLARRVDVSGRRVYASRNPQDVGRFREARIADRAR